MFIIKSNNNTSGMPSYFMSKDIDLTDLLSKKWCVIITNDVQDFSTFSDAEVFITSMMFGQTPQWWTVFDFYICEIDISLNIINEVKYSKNTAVNNVTNQATPTTAVDNDIDYTKPGEALKAHKQGKVVDWKKVAENRG